jgi:hypothetical protein
MRIASVCFLPRLLVTAIICATLFAGCGGAYEETISGVKVPVPRAMKKSGEKPAEIAILGFGAGQASFHGTMETDRIIEFYKKEMAERGWQPNLKVQGGGAMLAYSKEGKTVLVAIDKQEKETHLTLTVGGLGR